VFLGFIALAGGEVSLRQIELRGGGVKRVHGHDRTVFTNGAGVIIQCEPKLAEAAMQILVDRVDVIDPIQRGSSFLGFAQIFLQLGQFL